MIDKNQILEILEDWNLWRKELKSGYEREEYLKSALKFLKPNVILSFIGVRRSGKSYLMRQLAKKLIAGKIEKNSILIINFEDGRFTKFNLDLLDKIYETYVENLNPKDKPYIFLDEIDINVFPLSFKEFICFKGLEIKNKLDLVSKKLEIKKLLKEYLEFGGFPEIVLNEEKKILLLTYFDDILTEDIEKRYKIREGEKLRALAKFYLTNISNLITFNSLKKYLELSTDTIEKFSSYFEKNNLLFFIKSFSFKIQL